MYCIYTDNDVTREEGNYDHIFPLAFAGNSHFSVWSERHANSVIGSHVEGVLARDPLVQLALRNSGVKGHSKKAVVPRWKKVTMDGKPIQMTLGSDKIRYWDVKQHRELEAAEYAGKKFKAALNFKLDSCYRFVAKVGLAGGYFLYGDEIREAVDCDILRLLIFSDVDEVRQDKDLRDSAIRICDRFHPDSKIDAPGGLYRAICESIRRSIFISVPHQDAISFHVGIAGMFIGTIIVPAKTDQLPIDGDHDLGHTVVLGPGIMQRLSFRKLVQDFERTIEPDALTDAGN